jgi:hypothetical protein
MKRGNSSGTILQMSISSAMQNSPCAVVRAIGDAAFGNNLDPLRAVLHNAPDTWHLTPVRDPQFTDLLPLHVAVQASCVDAVNLLLVSAPRGAFSFTFSNGETRTVLQLAQRLLRADDASGAPGAGTRRDILMHLLCALVEIQDTVTDDMAAVVGDVSTRDVLFHRFAHAGCKTLLHVAIQNQRANIVSWLLDQGASPHVQCGAGDSALTLAERFDRPFTHGAASRVHRCVARAVEHPDVFLSYRRGPETAIAQRIFHTLTGPPFYLRVFYDGISAPVGVDWKSYLATVAAQAAVFVPLVSYDGVARRIIRATTNQKFEDECDSVLLECIISFACQDDGAKRCVPLCIGDITPGYPWSAFSFNPDVTSAAALPIPQEIRTLRVRHDATSSAARNLLAYIRPSAAPKADATVADVWHWFSTTQPYLFADSQLEAAAATHQADLRQLEAAKYNELCLRIKSASDAVPRPPMQPFGTTRGGRLSILNHDLGIIAGFAMGSAALFTVCSRMGFGALITNVRAGSIVMHFRLTITTKSTMALCQGYDRLQAWYDDGSLEHELGLGPLRFELEDCVDDSLIMLSHQQRCNLHDIDSKLAHGREGASLSQLKAHSQSPPVLSNDNLLALSTEDLQKIAQELGLKQNGSRNDLISHISAERAACNADSNAKAENSARAAASSSQEVSDATAESAACVSDGDLQSCMDAMSIFGDQSIDDVFTNEREDFAVNVVCIARAVQEAGALPQLPAKLLRPFQGADKMHGVVLELKRLFEGKGSRSQALDAVTSSGLEGLEQRTLVAAALLLFDQSAGVRAAASSSQEVSDATAEGAAACVSDGDLQSCMDAMSIFGDQSIDDVFTNEREDFAVNVVCIARAVQEAGALPQLPAKLLRPFQGADKMHGVVLELKRLFEGKGSRSQALDAVTSSGLEGLEQRTLVAAALLLFDQSGARWFSACDAAAPAPAASAHSPPSSSRAFVAAEPSAAVPAAARGPAAAAACFQAPSDSAMLKLRAAVVSLEDDSLEDLVLAPGTSDAAVTANSATLYIVLKSDADFAKMQPLLASLSSSLGHADLVLSVFQSMHSEYHSTGTAKRQLSDLLAPISSSPPTLSHSDISTVVNVASLLLDDRSTRASHHTPQATGLPDTPLPPTQAATDHQAPQPAAAIDALAAAAAAAARGPAAAAACFQAPSDSAMLKLRAAVVSLEDNSLEDLVLAPGTSDAAVTANSATLYIVLKSDADFAKVQPLLASLSAALPHAPTVLVLLRQLHEFNNFEGYAPQHCGVFV